MSAPGLDVELLIAFCRMPATVMNKRIHLISVLLLQVYCLIAAPMMEAGEPLDLMQSTVDRSLQLFKDPTLQSRDKEKERAERMREVVNSIGLRSSGVQRDQFPRLPSSGCLQAATCRWHMEDIRRGDRQRKRCQQLSCSVRSDYFQVIIRRANKVIAREKRKKIIDHHRRIHGRLL
jgi:hypothetical protein